MQPRALSLEPFILFGIIFFIFGVLPGATIVAWKFGVRMRVLIINLSLIVLTVGSFFLGKATGRSMAWYHWKTEYKEPLWELQAEVSEALKDGDTNRLIRIVRAFRSETISDYGHERLFERGKFREFVEHVKSGKASK